MSSELQILDAFRAWHGVARTIHPDEALPTGLDIIKVVEAAPGALADRLQASEWLLEFGGLTTHALTTAVDTLMALAHAEVTRLTKSGPRTFDVREAIVSAQVEPIGLLTNELVTNAAKHGGGKVAVTYRVGGGRRTDPVSDQPG